MRVDWTKARTEYIKDPTISLGAIGKKYGIEEQTVRVKSAEEGWVALRTEFQEEVNIKTTENLHKAAGEKADSLAKKSRKRSENWNILRQQLMLLIANMPVQDKDKNNLTLSQEEIKRRANTISVIISSMRDVNLGERLEDGQPLTIAKTDVSLSENLDELEKLKNTLGLSDRDFDDENFEETLKKVVSYYDTDQTTSDSETSEHTETEEENERELEEE